MFGMLLEAEVGRHGDGIDAPGELGEYGAAGQRDQRPPLNIPQESVIGAVHSCDKMVAELYYSDNPKIKVIDPPQGGEKLTSSQHH